MSTIGVTGMGNEAWERSVALLGSRAMGFLLDLQSDERPEADDDSRWTVVQEVAELSLHAGGLQAERRLSVCAAHLTSVLPDGTATYFEDVRRLVHGRLPRQTGNPLVDSLSRLAFNGLMIEQLEGADSDRFLLAASFQDPLLCRPAWRAVLDDEDLASLFPERAPKPAEERLDAALGLLMWVPFGGGTMDLRLVVAAIIEQTLARMRFDDALDESVIPEYVQGSIAEVKRFARQEEVEAVTLIGLLHVAIDEPINYGTWGLRSTAGLAIESFHGKYPRPESVIWQKVPYRLVSRSRNDVKEREHREQVQAAADQTAALREQTQAIFDTVRYAVVTWAARRATHVSLASTESWDMFPLKPTGPALITVDNPLYTPTRLGGSDLVEIAEIVDAVAPPKPTVSIALNRILRVSSEPRDAADALIDAVVAWENMFGSASETSFKVCASLAWLLQPEDADARSRLFNHAKRIYNLRSRLVHGDADVDENDGSQHRHEALRLAAEAFYRIHTDEHLRAISKSNKRAEHLLLRRDPLVGGTDRAALTEPVQPS